MSSENQEVATPVAQPEQQNSVLSGDPKTETPQVATDWKASLSEAIRSDNVDSSRSPAKFCKNM